jgi:hypothetical protein
LDDLLKREAAGEHSLGNLDLMLLHTGPFGAFERCSGVVVVHVASKNHQCLHLPIGKCLTHGVDALLLPQGFWQLYCETRQATSTRWAANRPEASQSRLSC